MNILDVVKRFFRANFFQYFGSEEAKLSSANAKDCASEWSSSSLSEPSKSSPTLNETSGARCEMSETIESDEMEPVWLL